MNCRNDDGNMTAEYPPPTHTPTRACTQKEAHSHKTEGVLSEVVEMSHSNELQC